jgi:hypothetical protein
MREKRSSFVEKEREIERGEIFQTKFARAVAKAWMGENGA